MASPEKKAALERRLRGASARVTPRDDDDDDHAQNEQATPRPPPFSPDEVPTQGKEIPRGDATPRDEDLRDASPRQGRSIPMDTSSFIYCPPRPPSLRETANADRAFLKEVMGDASTSLAGAEYGLKQVNELFKKIRLLNLNDEAATAFVDANRLFEEIQKDIGSARGNFGVAASAVSAAEQRDTMMVGVAEVAGDFYETQLQRLGLEDDLKGYLPRGADLLDTHRLSVKLLEVELASSTDRIDDVVYEQMQAVADRYLAMGSARIYHNDAARQATCAAADCYRMCCDYATNAVAAAASCRAAFIKDTAASATDFAKAANAASDASKQMMEAARYREKRALRQAKQLRENGERLQKEVERLQPDARLVADGARATPATSLPRSPRTDQQTMCEIRTALNDLGKADDPFERSGALEALAATLRREAPASVVMGAGTAELVATGGARKIAKEIADAPDNEADARLERLQSIARPHRIKEPLSPRRRHLLERNDLPVRGTLLEPPPVATRDLLEDLGLKSDAVRTVRDSSELSPRRSTMRRRPPADWELKASTRSDGDFGATLAEALANAAVDPVLRAGDSKLKASSRSGGDFAATLDEALATERVDTPPGE